MKDVGGLTVSQFYMSNVTVNATLTTIVVTPTSAVVLIVDNRKILSPPRKINFRIRWRRVSLGRRFRRRNH